MPGFLAQKKIEDEATAKTASNCCCTEPLKLNFSLYYLSSCLKHPYSHTIRINIPHPNAQGSQMLQLLSTIQLPKQCWRLTDPSSGPNGSTSVHSRHRRPHFLALRTLKLPEAPNNGIDHLPSHSTKTICLDYDLTITAPTYEGGIGLAGCVKAKGHR